MDIRIENLTKRYGPQTAVNNISFEVKPGEILGFLGPNGAGKTTTMKMITSYVNIDEGNIFIGGKSIATDAASLKKHIGYLPEHNPLYLEMAIMDYLGFCASLQGVSKSEIPARTREMIRVCGLNQEKHKRIGELSKGYRQRVGLAQAMIHDPEILILDEPTSGLDPNQIVEIRELIKTLGRQKTVVLSTHILPEVEATCDRILIINKGNIVADGTANTLRKQAKGQEVLQVTIEDGDPQEIYSKLQSLYTSQLVDLVPEQPHQFLIESVTEMSSKREVFKLCVQNNWVLSELTPLETKLEDIFRDLTLN